MLAELFGEHTGVLGGGGVNAIDSKLFCNVDECGEGCSVSLFKAGIVNLFSVAGESKCVRST